MRGTAFNAVFNAIYGKLNGDTGAGGLLNAVTPLVTGVFDEVPEGQAYPYITLGEATEARHDTMGNFKSECTITIHIWSQYKGYKQAFDILDRINYLLDYKESELAIAGFTTTMCRMEFTDAMRDPDGITRHVPVRYRIIVT